ncbi:MAG: hypothetical protein IJI46_07430 [Erysipelotrichaceae bacterium]|nr:hypothetical protein [Erysipelotrichaceae bacterium]
MRKIIACLFILLLLVSCGRKQEEEETLKPEYTYEIVSTRIDMSAYEGVSSTDHNFRLISVKELFNVIDNKSSGIFYFGRENCNCCQRVCKYLDEVAKELNQTVYYIDAYNQQDGLIEDKQLQEKLSSYLEPIMGFGEDGEKTLLTPHVFSVVNGEFYASQICFDDYSLDSETQIEKFKDSYRNIMKPFVE